MNALICSLTQARINANRLRWKNVPRHASVLLANADAASKSSVLSNVTVPCFSRALGAAGRIIRLWWLFFRMRQRAFQ